jgi:hypothetical protein
MKPKLTREVLTQHEVKATKTARDIVFFCCSTDQVLVCGKIPWMDYRDIPSRLIYNMDEVDRYNKSIVAESSRTKEIAFRSIFTIPPREGDQQNTLRLV